MRYPQRHDFLDEKDLPVGQSGRRRKASRVSGERCHPAVGRSARGWGQGVSSVEGPVSEAKMKDIQSKPIS